MKTVAKLYAICFTVLMLPAVLNAQNEVVREQISLEGLREVGFTANIEGSRTIADDEDLTPSAIRQDAVKRMVEADLRYVADEEVRSSADIPFLHLHINAMEMENGLIPFSIRLRLYQPVKLTLNRDLQTTASTWETAMVGLVSYDRIDVIRDAAIGVVDTFIEEYHQSNE
ncbi:MAG: hypothetical protein GVY08_10785 [Bacteroidetes bacterium]|nr:hypothetical protein [Bacteroidota bacterium]